MQNKSYAITQITDSNIVENFHFSMRTFKSRTFQPYK